MWYARETVRTRPLTRFDEIVMDTNPDATTRFLDPATLEGLGNMHIRARSLVEGIIAGLHRSPHRGGSVEFAEYAEYAPGHEIRHIDWKVFAKSDKYYVKQYEDETNLRVYLLLDGSGSMNFQGEDAPMTKARYCSFLAATFAYLFLRQGDAVGAMTFDEEVRNYLPASTKSSHLDDLFYLLDDLPSDRGTSLAKALDLIAERARSRSLIMVFSDLLDANEQALDLLRVLRSRRFEVALFHTLDRAELDLPYEGLTNFEGLEGEGLLLADPDDLRDQYQALFGEHLSRIKTQCEQGDIEYVRFTTDEPLEEVALRFLRGRIG